MDQEDSPDTLPPTEEMLVMPWGRVSVQHALVDPRCQAYLKYFQDLPDNRRDHTLNRILGLTSHRVRGSYPKERGR